jgi:hypothetical protein
LLRLVQGFFNNYNDDEFLLYGVYKTIDILVERIYNDNFDSSGTRKWKFQHVLRNVIAFHVFNIYEKYGLRVQIPTYVHKHNAKLAEWLQTSFMTTCEFLKKKLPDGKHHTATNVPFIIALIVVMIEKEHIYVKAGVTDPNDDGPKEQNLGDLFQSRTGEIIPLSKFCDNKWQKEGKLDQNDLWYFRHIKIRFGWTGQTHMGDLEQMVQSLVYGVNPFGEIPHEETEANDKFVALAFKVRLKSVMKKIELTDVDKVLRIVTGQETRAKMEVPVNGWFNTKEVSTLKAILTDTTEDDYQKKRRLHQEMQKMQNTCMAKLVNIGFHMALWAPTVGDYEILAAEKIMPSPLQRLTKMSEESLVLLKMPAKPKAGKKQTPKKGKQEVAEPITIMDFPKALSKMSEDLVQRSNKLIELCLDKNSLNGEAVRSAYETLSKTDTSHPTMRELYEHEDYNNKKKGVDTEHPRDTSTNQQVLVTTPIKKKIETKPETEEPKKALLATPNPRKSGTEPETEEEAEREEPKKILLKTPSPRESCTKPDSEGEAAESKEKSVAVASREDPVDIDSLDEGNKREHGKKREAEPRTKSRKAIVPKVHPDFSDDSSIEYDSRKYKKNKTNRGDSDSPPRIRTKQKRKETPVENITPPKKKSSRDKEEEANMTPGSAASKRRAVGQFNRQQKIQRDEYLLRSPPKKTPERREKPTRINKTKQKSKSKRHDVINMLLSSDEEGKKKRKNKDSDSDDEDNESDVSENDKNN